MYHKFFNIILIIAMVTIAGLLYHIREDNKISEDELFELKSNCADRAIEFAERRSKKETAYTSEWIVLRTHYDENKQSCFAEFMEENNFSGSCVGFIDYWIFDVLSLEYVDGYTAEQRDIKCRVDNSEETIEYLEKAKTRYENSSKEVFGTIKREFHYMND